MLLQSKRNEICKLESYELCRKKATEILTFLVSTSDREKSNDGIEHIPIAYALKRCIIKSINYA